MENLAALLDEARDLAAREQLDIQVMVELLDCLPIFDFDLPGQGAIIHAQMVAGAALDTHSPIHVLIARCALERVVAILERRVTSTFAVSQSERSTQDHRRPHGPTYDRRVITL